MCVTKVDVGKVAPIEVLAQKISLTSGQNCVMIKGEYTLHFLAIV
jgi:hypothetical protein